MKPSDPVPLTDPGSEAPALLRDAIARARARVPTATELARLASRLPSAAAPMAPPASVLPGVLIGGVLGLIVAVPIVARDAGSPDLASPRIQADAAPPAQRADPAPTVASPSRRPTEPPAVVTPKSSLPSAASAAPATAVIVASSATPGDADPAPAPAGDIGIAPPQTAGGEDEPQLLQRAHGLLAASPSEALTLTDVHARRFPGGALGQERELIAIEALVKLGRRRAATERAASFFAAYPRSAHRSRVEALIAR